MRTEYTRTQNIRIPQTIAARIAGVTCCLLLLCSLSLADEFGTYRLLSISESEKLILVSQHPGKTRYLLDASAAKITFNGEPAEYKALKKFATIQLKMEIRKLSKLGTELDGVATEIRITLEDGAK